MTIIDARNLILGRMASEVAQRALLGEKIELINCEEAVISGNRKQILAKHVVRMARGTPFSGPFLKRRPDMFVKRAIRGMLPHKRERGREAFSRIRCHRGVPSALEGKETETIKHADISKLPSLKYVTVKDICRALGAK